MLNLMRHLNHPHPAEHGQRSNKGKGTSAIQSLQAAMSQQPQCELYKDQSSFKVSADTYTHTGKLRKFKKKV